jgi:hypothetical protein
MEKKEELKIRIEENGLVCECGTKVYVPGTGPIENQPNYDKYFEFLECPGCRKQFYL